MKRDAREQVAFLKSDIVWTEQLMEYVVGQYSKLDSPVLAYIESANFSLQTVRVFLGRIHFIAVINVVLESGETLQVKVKERAPHTAIRSALESLDERIPQRSMEIKKNSARADIRCLPYSRVLQGSANGYPRLASC